jgi:hypothetical protein
MTCLFEILVGHYFHTVLLEKGISNKGILKAFNKRLMKLPLILFKI